jgi:uncharacterized protein YuzE
MAMTDLRPFLNMVPAVRASPGRSLWLTYDSDADVLYIHYKKPNVATDTELTDDDVVLRYKGDELIGMTVLHASTRLDLP